MSEHKENGKETEHEDESDGYSDDHSDDYSDDHGEDYGEDYDIGQKHYKEQEQEQQQEQQLAAHVPIVVNTLCARAVCCCLRMLTRAISEMKKMTDMKLQRMREVRREGYKLIPEHAAEETEEREALSQVQSLFTEHLSTMYPVNLRVLATERLDDNHIMCYYMLQLTKSSNPGQCFLTIHSEFQSLLQIHLPKIMLLRIL